MKFFPDLMTMEDGTRISSSDQWPARRMELIGILSKELYGDTPKTPERVQGTVRKENPNAVAGHAKELSTDICFDTPKGTFSFPMELFIPKGETRAPLFLLINFRKEFYDKYCPLEEIIDNGFAVAQVYYEDITADNADFTSGIAAQYPREGPAAWGKIGMWAFALSRAIDRLVTCPDIDPERIAVIGHSRLGKTALWCAAQDERVKYAVSNDSGCCGASLEKTRHEGGETLERITSVFPYWFCENARANAGCAQHMPYDQHFLVGACAPRYVTVGSASLDAWADPYSEQLCCIAASPAWKLFGKSGYIGPETPAQTGDDFGEGEIGYHLRDGAHFLSRADWQSYMAFLRRH